MRIFFLPIALFAIIITFVCCKSDSVCKGTNVVGNEAKGVKATEKKITADTPDTLIYCSVADEAPAGGGKNYIELINEKGKTELIVASDLNNHFGRPSSKQTYTLTAEDATALLKVIKDKSLLDAEVTPESQMEMPGAKQYRVRIEISGREVFTLRWYKACADADVVYRTLEHQFRELIQKYKK